MTSASRAALLVLALASTVSAQGSDPYEERVRVLTFNVWGIPVVTPRRAERMARIGAAVLALRPDVVCFQEVWLVDDQATLERDLAAGGLAHAQRFPSRPHGSGLLIVSRWPILRSAFTPFEVGGKPHQVWRGDWWGGKGVGRVRLRGPLGPLDLADAHLHARYGTDEFLGIQVSQAVDMIGALGNLGPQAVGARALADVVEDAWDDNCPMILAGDLNSRPGAPPFEVIAAGCGLRSVDRNLGIDHVLVRPGAKHELRVVSVGAVLKDEEDLGDGSSARLSDHHGVLIELALAPLTGDAAPVASAASAWRAAAEAGRAAIEGELAASSTRAWTARGLLVAALVAGSALAGRRRRSEPGRRRSALSLGLLLTSALGLWWAYAGLALEPWLQRGLGAAAEMLE